MALNIRHPVDGWGQHKQRGQMILFDQHRTKDFPDGRPWWTYTEKQVEQENGNRIIAPQPIGEPVPVSADIVDPDGTVIKGWSAPWYPEPKYMVMSINSRQGNRFKIRYDVMQTDYRAAMEEYYKRAVQEAATLNLPMPRFGEPIGYRLRQIVGEPPKSPKIPEAAIAGDPWLLGFSDEPNDLLRRYLYTGNSVIVTPEESESQPLGLTAQQISELVAQKVAEALASQPRRRRRAAPAT